jgi:hypothetical protein
MVLVFLGIGLLCLTIGIWLYAKYPNCGRRPEKMDVAICTFNTLGAILTSICVIASLILTGYLSMRPVIDDKITMYQEENTAIEQSVASVVTQYQYYEHDTYAELKTESPTVLISLFPELKSDTLISKQIEIYVANNQKIKELKEEKLNYTPMA